MTSVHDFIPGIMTTEQYNITLPVEFSVTSKLPDNQDKTFNPTYIIQKVYLAIGI